MRAVSARSRWSCGARRSGSAGGPLRPCRTGRPRRTRGSRGAGAGDQAPFSWSVARCVARVVVGQADVSRTVVADRIVQRILRHVVPGARPNQALRSGGARRTGCSSRALRTLRPGCAGKTRSASGAGRALRPRWTGRPLRAGCARRARRACRSGSADAGDQAPVGCSRVRLVGGVVCNQADVTRTVVAHRVVQVIGLGDVPDTLPSQTLRSGCARGSSHALRPLGPGWTARSHGASRPSCAGCALDPGWTGRSLRAGCADGTRWPRGTGRAGVGDQTPGGWSSVRLVGGVVGNQADVA